MDPKDWQRFLNNEIYLFCESKDDLKSFLSLCDSQDIGWYGGGEKVPATKNRTFIRYNKEKCYFEYALGHLWSIPEYIRKLSTTEIVPYRR